MIRPSVALSSDAVVHVARGSSSASRVRAMQRGAAICMMLWIGSSRSVRLLSSTSWRIARLTISSITYLPAAVCVPRTDGCLDP